MFSKHFGIEAFMRLAPGISNYRDSTVEREAAVRVEASQRKANSLAKREAELHRREAAVLDEEERLNKRREAHGLVKNSLDARETALNTKELGVKVR